MSQTTTTSRRATLASPIVPTKKPPLMNTSNNSSNKSIVVINCCETIDETSTLVFNYLSEFLPRVTTTTTAETTTSAISTNSEAEQQDESLALQESENVTTTTPPPKNNKQVTIIDTSPPITVTTSTPATPATPTITTTTVHMNAAVAVDDNGGNESEEVVRLKNELLHEQQTRQELAEMWRKQREETQTLQVELYEVRLELDYYKQVHEEMTKLMQVPKEDLAVYLKNNIHPLMASGPVIADRINMLSPSKKPSLSQIIKDAKANSKETSNSSSNNSNGMLTTANSTLGNQQVPTEDDSIMTEEEMAQLEKKTSLRVTTRTKSLFRPRSEPTITAYDKRNNSNRTRTVRLEDTHVWAEEFKKMETENPAKGSPPPPPPRNRSGMRKNQSSDDDLAVSPPLVPSNDLLSMLISEFNEGCMQVKSSLSPSASSTLSPIVNTTATATSNASTEILSDVSSQSDLDTDDVTSCGTTTTSTTTIAMIEELGYDKDLYDQFLKPTSTLQECIRLFNQDKSDQCFKLMSELYQVNDQTIAKFLADVGLNKTVLGTYLGHDKNEPILKEYCDYVISRYFRDCDFESVLRNFFILFKMPLEGQQVTRIAYEFSTAFVKHNPTSPVGTDPDTCFLLVCSLFMVNTEYHNPRATTKMNKQQFLAIFSHASLNSTFLTDLFESIRKNAMVLPTSSNSTTTPSSEDDIHTAEDLLMAINSCHTDQTPDNLDQLFYFEFYKSVIMMSNNNHNNNNNSGNNSSNNNGMTCQIIDVILRDCHPRLKYQDHLLKSDKNLPRELQRGRFYILIYNIQCYKSFAIANKLVDRIVQLKKSSENGTDDDAQPQQQQQQMNEEHPPVYLVGLSVSSCLNSPDKRQVTHRQGIDIALDKGIAFFEIQETQLGTIINEACTEMLKLDNPEGSGNGINSSIERPRAHSDGKKLSLEDLLVIPKLYI